MKKQEYIYDALNTLFDPVNIKYPRYFYVISKDTTYIKKSKDSKWKVVDDS